jgi:hypothetical protein|tara:strand:+ start:856 stop:1518 length:663 start_codon:yes stop_codon:yes gene_type:complete
MAEPTNYKVFLELQRRNDVGTGTINRIALSATSVGITTSKTIPNIPVPLAGAVSGESVSLAFDMGLASKAISISGILLEQSITKTKTTDSDAVTATFTPFELAQLIHSYVDSSSFQDDQNINKIIILIPSKVGNDFTARGSQIDIPFTFKNREYDNEFTKFTDSPVEAFEEGNSISDRTFEGITGFVRSFSTTFASEQPNNVEFTLEFEEAKVIADNFFD